MAALNFVAADDGLEDDPKVLTLARLLNVPRPMAFWYVIRWQRLILQRGNHLSASLPKNYTADDIAAFLEFKGGARRLVDAMRSQGFIGFKRGRGFFYPAWNETITGRYARRREEDRCRHEQSRKGGKPSRLSADVLGPSADASSDGPRTSSRHPTVRKEERIGESPPDPPPSGGALVADARWSWLVANAPTRQNRNGCKKMLEAMSDEDWACVQWGYGLLHTPGASISKKDRRVLHWPTDQFLRKQAYLRFQPPRDPSTTVTRSRGPLLEKIVESDRERISKRDEYIAGRLREPGVPEWKKNEMRDLWLANPDNKGRTPPWADNNGAPPTSSERGA